MLFQVGRILAGDGQTKVAESFALRIAILAWAEDGRRPILARLGLSDGELLEGRGYHLIQVFRQGFGGGFQGLGDDWAVRIALDFQGDLLLDQHSGHRFLGDIESGPGFLAEIVFEKRNEHGVIPCVVRFLSDHLQELSGLVFLTTPLSPVLRGEG